MTVSSCSPLYLYYIVVSDCTVGYLGLQGRYWITWVKRVQRVSGMDSEGIQCSYLLYGNFFSHIIFLTRELGEILVI